MITFNDITYDTENLSGRGRVRGAEFEFKYDAEFFRFGFNQAIYDTRSDARVYTSPYNGVNYYFGSAPFVLAAKTMSNVFLTLNQNEKYPTTFWYHYIGQKSRKTTFTSADGGYASLMPPNGSTPAQDYLNITQQVKGVAKNMDLAFGVQNLFGKTQKTLYLPLNQPNTQDVAYMGQMFWVNMTYKF